MNWQFDTLENIGGWTALEGEVRGDWHREYHVRVLHFPCTRFEASYRKLSGSGWTGVLGTFQSAGEAKQQCEAHAAMRLLEALN